MKRPSTRNDLQQRITRVLRHMERRHDSRLSVPALAKVACISPFHFSRVFAAYTGETPHACWRRLKLEAAARQLAQGRSSVTEAALDAGFETPEAFSKAFKAAFGLSPQEFKKPTRAAALAPGIKEQAMQLKPEIVTLPTQNAYAVRRHGPYHLSAAQAWKALSRWAGPKGLFKGAVLYGLSHDEPRLDQAETMAYDACLATARKVEPTGDVRVLELSGGRFASFRYVGSFNGLAKVYDAIYRDWLPNSGYQLRDAPAMDRYVRPGFLWIKPITEILVPIA